MIHNLLYINQFYLDRNRLCHPAIGNYAEVKYDFILKLGCTKIDKKILITQTISY